MLTLLGRYDRSGGNVFGDQGKLKVYPSYLVHRGDRFFYHVEQQ